MEILLVEDYIDMTKKLKEIFIEQLKKKPDSILSFTTGRTPEGLLEELAVEVNHGLDISQAVFFNLDEYVGKRDGKYSVYRFMYDYFYSKISIRPREIFMIDGETKNPEEEIERYKRLLDQYPRDIQLLGLGENGHIGANEPGTSFDSSMFIAKSVETTVLATQKLYGLTYDETPKSMYTLGFQEILAANCVVLAASGKSKAAAVKAVVEGEITEDIPASILQNHKNCIVVIDEQAASLLSGNI